MQRILSLLLASILCIALGPACDSDESGVAAFSTGLATSSALEDLSDEDAYSLCLSAAQVYEQFEAILLGVDPCVEEGLTAKFQEGGTTGTCEDAMAECHASSESDEAAADPDIDASTAADTCDPDAGAGRLAGCDVTVAEYEACSNALLSKIQDVADSYNCNLTLEDIAAMDIEGDAFTPAECDKLEQEGCQILGDSGSSPEEG